MCLMNLWRNNHRFIQQSNRFQYIFIDSKIFLFSVIEQVQNKKLTTFPLDHLNKLFAETEAQVKKSVIPNIQS
jgi:hypothetical protein